MTTAAMRRAAPLLKANRERSRDAAAGQIDRAEIAMERLRFARPTTRSKQEVVARYRLALQLRLDYPTDTLAQLAARSGWSKDRYWTILSRALKYRSHR